MLRYNLFARVAFGLPYHIWGSIDPSTYRHYVAPLATPLDRVGSWMFARELRQSREWLERLWDRREAVFCDVGTSCPRMPDRS